MISLLLLPIRLAFGLTKLGTKIGYRTGRAIGYKRIFVFAAGVGLGLLLAPTTGREARARLKELFDARRPVHTSDPDLGERVRVELRRATRTWHLPQPEVAVENGRVVLRGQVPHETARTDFERTAATVPGVTGVENNLVVVASNGH